MTFKEVWLKILNILKSNAAELGVPVENIGEILPMQIIKATPPYIYVCIEPVTSSKNSDGTEFGFWANVDIFCADSKIEGEAIEQVGNLVARIHKIHRLLANLGIVYISPEYDYDSSTASKLQIILNFDTQYGDD